MDRLAKSERTREELQQRYTMLTSNTEVSIVVPIYDEELNITILYERITHALSSIGKSYEILFIDDGSRDNSYSILKDISDSDSRVKVIKLRRNFGQTAALTAGFDHSHGVTIVTIDGDLQNDPHDIPRLLDKLDEGYDIVSGWRRDRKDPRFSKGLPSKISNKLASKLVGIDLHDFGCTLKAYRREVIEEINLYGQLHRYIPAVASAVGVRVAEIEVKHNPRNFGKSKYGMGRLFRGAIDLMSLKLLLSYMHSPMQMFGALGLLTITLASMSSVATILMKIFMSFDITGNPMLYLSLIAFIAGIQFFSLGFLGEISVRTYHETQKKPIYVVQNTLDGSREIA